MNQSNHQSICRHLAVRPAACCQFPIHGTNRTLPGALRATKLHSVHVIHMRRAAREGASIRGLLSLTTCTRPVCAPLLLTLGPPSPSNSLRHCSLAHDQVHGANVLHSILVKASPAAAQAVVDAGGIEAVLAAMAAHPVHDLKVQRGCLTVLEYLLRTDCRMVADEPARRRIVGRIMAGGGIMRLLLAVLKACPPDDSADMASGVISARRIPPSPVGSPSPP